MKLDDKIIPALFIVRSSHDVNHNNLTQLIAAETGVPIHKVTRWFREMRKCPDRSARLLRILDPLGKFDRPS